MSNVVHIKFKSFETSRLPSTRSSPCRLIVPNPYQKKLYTKRKLFNFYVCCKHPTWPGLILKLTSLILLGKSFQSFTHKIHLTQMKSWAIYVETVLVPVIQNLLFVAEIGFNYFAYFYFLCLANSLPYIYFLNLYTCISIIFHLD